MPASDNTEQEFIQKDTHECIRAELTKIDMIAKSKKRRAMNLQIFDLWTKDYSFTEISETLGIAKGTLHGDLIRIAKIAKEYID